MSDIWYPKGAEKLWSGLVDVTSATIKAALVSSAYTFNTAHEFYSDISANVIGTPQTLGSKAVTGGMFDAGDPTWTAVAGGSTVKAIVLYKDTGVAGTSPVLVYLDQFTGFPFATNGSDVTIQWNNGTYKIAGIS